MKITTLIYQRFDHPIISGTIWGFADFVFAISFENTNSIKRKFEMLGTTMTAGELSSTIEILEYLDGVRKNFSVMPKFLWGTPFQKRVWWVTSLVPYSEVITYSELAGQIGELKSARAVGNALGKNPTPLIIPCHRVIRSDNSLGGFTAGVELKKKLLELEGIFV